MKKAPPKPARPVRRLRNSDENLLAEVAAKLGISPAKALHMTIQVGGNRLLVDTRGVSLEVAVDVLKALRESRP